MIIVGFIAGWLACRLCFYFTTERPMLALARQTKEFLKEHPLR